MDLFGEALKAYALGDRTKFYFKESSGEISECSLKRYFRNTAQISKSERKLFSLSYGKILDVGCGTGNYMPLLVKRGKVVGIDISKNAIDVAKLKGCNNCRVADIFTLSAKKKFDTITLLGNNIGIGGSVDKTKKLLNKLSSILKDDGQILAIVRRVTGRGYFANRLQPMWNNKIGSKFGWIHLNVDFLSDLCRQEGLCLKILQGNQHSYLVKIGKTRERKAPELHKLKR